MLPSNTRLSVRALSLRAKMLNICAHVVTDYKASNIGYTGEYKKRLNSKYYLKITGKVKCKILSIDAWRESDGGWTWNNLFNTGDKIALNDTRLTTRKLLKLLREIGALTSYSTGTVAIEDDGYNIVVVDKNTRQPLIAIEYGVHY
jgi:hypothetical protein